MDEDSRSTTPQTNTFLAALKAHRVYGAAAGYLVAAWIILQVAAIVLPGFGAPAWVLRALMILLALGLGVTLLAVWGKDRRAGGLPLVPRTRHTRLAWVLTAILPAALVAGFFLLRPLNRPASFPAPPATVVTAPPVEKSVAVLPFDNFSEDKNSAFFADGVQDEVLTDLAHVADLKVISRSSVLQYKDAKQRNLREIGKTLGVAYVVEGSVQRAGNRVKVNAQLIDTRTDGHLWAEQYVRELQDVFTIQTEIAQKIAGQLQAAISPREHAAMTEWPTADEAAYELYLRAVALWNDYETITDSHAVYRAVLDLLRQATARDPNFVRAFVLMAEVQASTFRDLEQSAQNDAAARGYAETVARLRPGSADANLAMGYYHYAVKHDLARAREEFAEVIRQSPNDANAYRFLATIARRQGNQEEALAILRRALELDPENNNTFNTYIGVLQGLHRYADLTTAVDRRLAVHPQQNYLIVTKAYLRLAWQADTRAARVELARLPAGFDLDGQATSARMECGAMERDVAALERDLAACSLAEINNGVPREWYEGEIARYRRDEPAAARAYTKAHQRLEEKARTEPNSVPVLMSLALVDAAMGHREIALDEGRYALTKAPVDDAVEWPSAMYYWAIVLTRVGDREEAIRVLQQISGRPYGPDYGWLKLHPDWDPLRGDPRFEAMVTSLAPK